jgi:hypothetical protein
VQARDGDFRDWATIESWAEGIATALGAPARSPEVVPAGA